MRLLLCLSFNVAVLREDGVKTTMSKKRSRSEADDDGATWYIKYPGEEKRSGQTDFIFTIYYLNFF